MKKTFSFITLFTLIIFSFSSSALADSKEYEVIYPEKSIEESYQDAINGIADLPVSNFNITSDLSVIKESGAQNKDSIDIKEYSTSQILSQTVKNGETEQFVSVTIFNDIDINEEEENIYNPAASYDKGAEKSDDSYGAKAYSRLYYTTTVKEGITHATLNRVTGSWSVSDHTLNLSNKIVRFGASGWPSGSQSTVRYPSDNTSSYSYNAPSSWNSVALTGAYSFGTNSTVTIKKGNSTWTLKLVNDL